MKQNSVHTIPDVQSYADNRNIVINEVGIKELSYPIKFNDGKQDQATIATYYMTVCLPADRKGTHMSRFVKIINEQSDSISVGNIATILDNMLKQLDATMGRIELKFPLFLDKVAPVSKLKSKMDYLVTLAANRDDTKTTTIVKIVIPVTSLCPCSKEVAAYSAHNQRSHIIITIDEKTTLSIHALINLVEKQASSELYSLLKRSDEKFVTEHAYDHPKFVEDMVRDVAGELIKNTAVGGFIVETENFESIHNHSAYARIRHGM